jgi:hypothetical protein
MTDRRSLASRRAAYRAAHRSQATGANRNRSGRGGTFPRRAPRRRAPVQPRPRDVETQDAPAMTKPSAPGLRRSPGCVPAAPQGHCVIDQSVLQTGRLLMMFHLLGRRLPNVDDRQPITVIGADLVVECGGQWVHGRPPSIRFVEDRQGSVGAAGRGGSSPCVAVPSAVPTKSLVPAKGSRPWRRSSQWTTFSRASWPALGYGLNRLNVSAVPGMVCGALSGLDQPLPPVEYHLRADRGAPRRFHRDRLHLDPVPPPGPPWDPGNQRLTSTNSF